MNEKNFDGLIAYCEQCADTNRNLAERVLNNIGKGESQQTALGAYAYFKQQEEMLRYVLPGIIRAYLSEDGGQTR